MIRSKGRFQQACSTVAAALLLVSIPVMTRAEGDPDPNQALKDEKARLDARAEVVKARADLARARIEALGLPSFEGTRTVNAGAGAIEASMLSTTAVRRASQIIAGRLVPAPRAQQDYTGNYILLAGDEELDFARAGAMLTQMDAIKTLFDQIPRPPAPRRQRPTGPATVVATNVEMAFSPTLALGAISAAAGLLRSNVELSALETDAISDHMLVSAIASQLGDRAILPSALIGVLEPCPEDAPQSATCLGPAPLNPDDWARRNLIHRFNRLVERRDETKRIRDGIPAQNQTPEEARYVAAADRAIARFDTFFTDSTTPDDDGIVPIAQAGRLDLLRRAAGRIVRVYVAEHSGSLVKTTNLLTTLGADPLRVSGALVARYQVTDPNTGTQRGGGILTCQTALATLSRVQRWDWAGAAGPTAAQCQEQ